MSHASVYKINSSLQTFSLHNDFFFSTKVPIASLWFTTLLSPPPTAENIPPLCCVCCVCYVLYSGPLSLLLLLFSQRGKLPGRSLGISAILPHEQLPSYLQRGKVTTIPIYVLVSTLEALMFPRQRLKLLDWSLSFALSSAPQKKEMPVFVDNIGRHKP